MAGSYIRGKEHREKMRKLMTGRTLTPEWKRKIGMSKKGKSPRTKPTWDRTGERNPCWRGGHKTKRNCLYCGNEFEAYNRDIKRGFGKFCSHQCRAIFVKKHMPNKETSIEKILEKLLIDIGIDYAKQFPIKNIAIVDFYLPEHNLIIEADGDYWHRLPDKIDRDTNRDFKLSFCGYNILRLTESELNNNIKKCRIKIFKAIYGNIKK